ncbi:MAG: hypothetical protein BGO10_00160 [Chlamydia sp. 32-24]|nr:MAG: hypothetical protein BGO10_00160 [Chlamydia sp. 32-24]
MRIILLCSFTFLLTCLFSTETIDQWLIEVDKGFYQKSWALASKTFQETISKEDWVKWITKKRLPLGEVQERIQIEEKKTINPKGLPAGTYKTIFYRTIFSNKKSGYELLTLVLDEHKWLVVTYHLK